MRVDVARWMDLPHAERLRFLKSGRGFWTRAAVEHALVRLDEERYRNPAEAAELTAILAAEVVPGIASPAAERMAVWVDAMGVLGSSYRIGGRLQLAAACLARGLDYASELADASYRPRLLLRAAWVFTSQARYASAIAVTEEALALYQQAGDRVGAAKALIQRGSYQGLVGDLRVALESFYLALPWLPRDEKRYRSAVHMWMGNQLRIRGALDEARAQIELGGSLLAGGPGHDRAIFLWSLADLDYLCGDLEAALVKLEAARTMLAQVNPYEMALVLLEEVTVLLEVGNDHQAERIAKSTAALLEPLRHNKIAEAAILEFARTAIAGRVSRKIIDETRRRVQFGYRRRA